MEPLEDFEASILASPWNHGLSLNNQSVIKTEEKYFAALDSRHNYIIQQSLDG